MGRTFILPIVVVGSLLSGCGAELVVVRQERPDPFLRAPTHGMVAMPGFRLERIDASGARLERTDAARDQGFRPPRVEESDLVRMTLLLRDSLSSRGLPVQLAADPTAATAPFVVRPQLRRLRVVVGVTTANTGPAPIIVPLKVPKQEMEMSLRIDTTGARPLDELMLNVSCAASDQCIVRIAELVSDYLLPRVLGD